MCRALVDSRRVTWVSGNGAGKTAVAGEVIVPWFLSTRKPACVVTISSTWAQLETQMWQHIRIACKRASQKGHKLPGRVLETQWKIQEGWYATAFSTDKEERFQGFHQIGLAGEEGDEGGSLLVIVDEASGVADFAFKAILGYLTGADCYALYLGNGNRAEGPFYESHQNDRWEAFQNSAYDVPRHILSQDWIDEADEQLGIGTPAHDVRVMGKFPAEGGTHQIIPKWILEGASQVVPPADEDIDQGRHMGVDVARQGHDYNVATVTDNGLVVHTERWAGMDLMETATKVRHIMADHDVPPHHVHVDVGMGAGVIDRLAEDGIIVDSVDFGSAPKHDWDEMIGTKFKFLNRKAELHWVGRQLLMKKRASIPAQYALTWRQLQWINYDHKEDGKLFIEPKIQLKKRTGESPDDGDAWILSLSRTGTAEGWVSFL